MLIGVSPFDKVYGSEALGRVQYLNVHDYHVPREHTSASLDPNHTHHILVGGDGGGGGGVDIPTRNLIEEAICRVMPDEDDEADSHTEVIITTSPMVLLVVGGGYGTIQTVLEALTAKEGSTACPVVLVPEAKGAGQYIYEAVHLSAIYTPEQVAQRL